MFNKSPIRLIAQNTKKILGCTATSSIPNPTGSNTNNASPTKYANNLESGSYRTFCGMSSQMTSNTVGSPSKKFNSKSLVVTMDPSSNGFVHQFHDSSQQVKYILYCHVEFS